MQSCFNFQVKPLRIRNKTKLVEHLVKYFYAELYFQETDFQLLIRGIRNLIYTQDNRKYKPFSPLNIWNNIRRLNDL